MSKALAAILATTALGSGYLLGNHNGDKDKDYRIVRQDGIVQLQALNVGEEYPLTKIGNRVYLGDSAHNYNGLRALVEQEITKKIASERAMGYENAKRQSRDFR